MIRKELLVIFGVCLAACGSYKNNKNYRAESPAASSDSLVVASRIQGKYRLENKECISGARITRDLIEGDRGAGSADLLAIEETQLADVRKYAESQCVVTYLYDWKYESVENAEGLRLKLNKCTVEGEQCAAKEKFDCTRYTEGQKENKYFAKTPKFEVSKDGSQLILKDEKLNGKGDECVFTYVKIDDKGAAVQPVAPAVDEPAAPPVMLDNSAKAKPEPVKAETKPAAVKPVQADPAKTIDALKK